MADLDRGTDVKTSPEIESVSEKARHMNCDANNQEISSKESQEKFDTRNTCDTADTLSVYPVTTIESGNDVKSTDSYNLESLDKTSELTALFGKKKKSKKERKMCDAKSDQVEADQENEEKFISDNINIETDLDFLKWGKKKPRKPKNDNLEFEDGKEKTADKQSVILTENPDVDYKYDQLLNFVYGSIKINNPELMPGEIKKLRMPYAQVLRDGVRKTGLYNFMEICKALHREPKHLFDFILMEFAASGSVDMRNKLTLVGVYRQKQVQAVITRYVREYVECKTCTSTETILIKKKKMQFLVCEYCKSQYTVSPINRGFRAVARRDMRRR